ncbi:hypothetical protein [Pseudaminobacter sp. NGMCC 1.201702]|uniref:hypothetical protein n=1 Tax=Pseudaminobacter sp. NGMCC 1.201702 TaxID=3391825 RepID=UPI0039EF139D
MNLNALGIFRAIGHYAGKLQTLRDEIRTERMMNALPYNLRRDIGWPDDHAERLIRRR